MSLKLKPGFSMHINVHVAQLGQPMCHTVDVPATVISELSTQRLRLENWLDVVFSRHH